MKYILTSIIEIKIEEIYDRLSIPPELKEQIHDVFKDVILKKRKIRRRVKWVGLRKART